MTVSLLQIDLSVAVGTRFVRVRLIDVVIRNITKLKALAHSDGSIRQDVTDLDIAVRYCYTTTSPAVSVCMSVYFFIINSEKLNADFHAVFTDRKYIYADGISI